VEQLSTCDFRGDFLWWFSSHLLKVMASWLFTIPWWFGGGMLQWCCNVAVMDLWLFVIVVYCGGLDICL
jgi:hypothetical protein